jgi:hypothetical protein
MLLEEKANNNQKIIRPRKIEIPHGFICVQHAGRSTS